MLSLPLTLSWGHLGQIPCWSPCVCLIGGWSLESKPEGCLASAGRWQDLLVMSASGTGKDRCGGSGLPRPAHRQILSKGQESRGGPGVVSCDARSPPPAACTAVVKARGGLGQEGSIATSESMCSGAGEGVPTGLRPQADCEPAGPLSRPPNLIPLSSLFAFVYCLTDSPSFPPLPLLPAPAPICDLNSLPLPPLQRIPTGQFSDRRPPSSPGGCVEHRNQ